MKKKTETILNACIETAGKVSRIGTAVTVGSFLIGYCLAIFKDIKCSKKN